MEDIMLDIFKNRIKSIDISEYIDNNDKERINIRLLKNKLEQPGKFIVYFYKNYSQVAFDFMK